MDYCTTFLHLAIDNKDIGLTEVFLNHEANVNATNTYGTTPLHRAIENENMGLIELLLSYGANVNASKVTYTGITLLHIAAQNEYSQLSNFSLDFQYSRAFLFT
ncbi:26S proteasome non-ATPase regulatory subunit 10-like [Pseudomyrmex gracilis]|uniref:26S proteasome non-ATPase regulatory subunit 10-like n=1 Tax=Pseudomyrmex gracilis TaxID=219809 RepID=UPI0009954CBC|nr:26S proteasome non-ATPase regulatory subunit 10-like [Pseudomyrmex gracilis]